MSAPLHVAMLTRYAATGASSRVRALQFRPLLGGLGIQTTVYPLLGDAYLETLYAGRRDKREILRAYLDRLVQAIAWRRHDLLWIEKELFPLLPAWFEQALLIGRPYVLDFDDAVFHNYDLSRHMVVRGLLGKKLDRLMRGAALVTAGNSYLAERACQAGAQRVEWMPSCVDLQRYPPPTGRSASTGPLRVVWIGSPTTVGYLDLLREPLLHLAAKRPLLLKVVGAAVPAWAQQYPLKTQALPWSVGSEARDIAAADVGVMPLHDSPWEQGKCSFKLIQYMACGLPVIASPVGMNRDVVQSGQNGLLASTATEWFQALNGLAENPALRQRMGQLGRAQVEQSYCIQTQAPRLADWLGQIAEHSR